MVVPFGVCLVGVQSKARSGRSRMNFSYRISALLEFVLSGLSQSVTLDDVFLGKQGAEKPFDLSDVFLSRINMTKMSRTGKADWRDF